MKKPLSGGARPRTPERRPDRRALSNVGGPVQASGDPSSASLLATAFNVEPDEEASRIHVHGFHSYPARLHPTVARRLIELLSPSKAVILDPFCGSGTVLVEARLAGRLALGLDLNPLAVLLSRVKAYGGSDEDLETFLRLATEVSAHAQARRKAKAGATRRYPETDTKQFEPHVLLELDGLRSGIEALAKGFTRDVLLLVLSSIMTKVSRKQGDTGLVDEQPRRLAGGYTSRLFEKRARELCERIRSFTSLVPEGAPRARVELGDARAMEWVRPSSVDLVVTSPPYPGNYDYLAHHDTRMRWLDLDVTQFAKGEIGARRRLVTLSPEEAWQDFANDLLQVLQKIHRVLRPSGAASIVMADTAIGRRALWAEALVKDCAHKAGLTWVATASQPRPHFHGPTAGVFLTRPRREHVILLNKEQPRTSVRIPFAGR